MRRLALSASVVLAVGVGLVLLRPILLAPVTGDDVVNALEVAADPDRTIRTEITELPADWRYRYSIGRVNVLTAVERRVSNRAMVNTAVATGRPVNQVLGTFKLGYAALSLFAVYALIRAIRWRRRDSGSLVQMEGRTRAIAMIAGGLGFAVGAQPQLSGPSGGGWLAYPVSTWTAAFSIFGVVALTLWLARLAAVRGWVVGVPAALLLGVIGVVSNYRYELTFPALPLTLLALVLLPVSDREHRAAGLRAKWLLGSAYGVGFGVVFVANRMQISDVCAEGGCYSGVSLALGSSMLRTFVINVASSIPGTGREEVSALLRAESLPTDGIWTPTLWSVLTALVLVVTLALAWLGGGPRLNQAAGSEETRAQAVVCVMAAVLLTTGGLGAAAVMSLSERAQRFLPEIGLFYRHSVVTWLGLAFGAVLLVLALGLWRSRLALPSFVALALVLAILTATRMPADGSIMEANSRRLKPSLEVFNELVRGETGDRANHRRCRILRLVDREAPPGYAPRIRLNAEKSYERYWHVPFCHRG